MVLAAGRARRGSTLSGQTAKPLITKVLLISNPLSRGVAGKKLERTIDAIGEKENWKNKLFCYSDFDVESGLAERYVWNTLPKKVSKPTVSSEIYIRTSLCKRAYFTVSLI